MSESGGTQNTASIPAGAGETTATSGNVANAVANATLPSAPGQFAYLTGFEITAAGATAASVVLVSVVGAAGGTINYVYAVPAGAAVGVAPLVVAFNPPLKAAAVNTQINVSLPALGAGNTNAIVNAHGYLS